MALESATYISELDPAKPAGTDSRTEGDNVFRLIKTVLQNTLPNANGAITASVADLNTLVSAASTGASPRVVTQTAGDSSTKAASTAFVTAAVAAASTSNTGPLVMWALYRQGIV